MRPTLRIAVSALFLGAPCLSQAASADMDAAIARLIDESAGHPDDPQLPKGVLGVSDAALLVADPQQIATLLQQGGPLLKRNPKQPRIAFALGRAAIAHGYDSVGRKRLEQAAAGGSAAARAHLAYLADARGEQKAAKDMLATALRGGFRSPQAIATYKELVDAAVHPEDFVRADWIRMLIDGRDLRAFHGLHGITYIMNIHNFLSSESVLFVVENSNLHLELDSRLGVIAGRKLVGSPNLINQAARPGLGGLVEGLKAMADARKSGKSISEETSAMGSAMLKRMDPMAIVAADAGQDGRRMARLYDWDPTLFRKIYNNMRRAIDRTLVQPTSREVRRQRDLAVLGRSARRPGGAAPSSGAGRGEAPARPGGAVTPTQLVAMLRDHRARSGRGPLLYRDGDVIHMVSDHRGGLIQRTFAMAKARGLLARLDRLTPARRRASLARARSARDRARLQREHSLVDRRVASGFFQRFPQFRDVGANDAAGIRSVMKAASTAPTLAMLLRRVGR